jgi:hypothetical protein
MLGLGIGSVGLAMAGLAKLYSKRKK